MPVRIHSINDRNHKPPPELEVQTNMREFPQTLKLNPTYLSAYHTLHYSGYPHNVQTTTQTNTHKAHILTKHTHIILHRERIRNIYSSKI